MNVATTKPALSRVKSFTVIKIQRRPASVSKLEQMESEFFDFKRFRDLKHRQEEREAALLQRRLDLEAEMLAKAKTVAEEAAQAKIRSGSAPVTTAEWRALISRALVLNDVEAPGDLFSDREYANILITKLEDRCRWRLFETSREARVYISKEGEWAWRVLEARTAA